MPTVDTGRTGFRQVTIASPAALIFAWQGFFLVLKGLDAADANATDDYHFSPDRSVFSPSPS